MAAWDDEDSDGSAPAIVKKSKFDDEEEETEIADAWDADDSDEEREKAKKKAEADAKKAAEAAANKKSKTERIAEHQAKNAAERERLAQLLEEADDPRLAKELGRQAELEADLATAGDLLGAVAIGSQNTRRSAGDRSLLQHTTESGEHITLDLADLPLFQPKLKAEFDDIRTKLVPLFANMSKKGHYPIFLTEFFRETAKSLSSEQIKKIGSALTTLSNERMREEKAADTKGKKVSKAKTKATVTLGGSGAGKSHTADTTNYDNAIDEYDDFM
ncbi:Eukaryotic translation initiation factor [Drechslerella dactyloides]|uniref:Eukaryotic translation initiation factor 3 subunit J n=1 Tax=Drechslerella dactyloides TaxID=74499 RepID=A0AAD6IWF2_DREDA|nr:Eukaryotic translation initiation factor [Drechslerella dactyloides]